MPYSPLLVKPFRDELTVTGIKELPRPDDVDNLMKMPGTTMVVVNSVCGCAAGTARPGISQALGNKKKAE